MGEESIARRDVDGDLAVADLKRHYAGVPAKRHDDAPRSRSSSKVDKLENRATRAVAFGFLAGLMVRRLDGGAFEGILLARPRGRFGSKTEHAMHFTQGTCTRGEND